MSGRVIVVGQDAHGRSCVVSDSVIGATNGKFVSQHLWKTDNLPPEVEASRRMPHEPAVLVTAPGGSSFVHATFPPGFESPMHRTDSLDYGVIIAGSATLGLSSDEVDLDVGDCWILPGLPHLWRTGGSGVTIACTSLGLGPLATRKDGDK
jgi:quercetin dioxygenase-like cupin family protein